MTLLPPSQRLAHLAAPGSLLKKPVVRMPSGGRPPVTDAAYLSMVRLCPCLRCGLDGFSEAAHLRAQSGSHGKHGGIGKKPHPKWTLPLCAGCHREDNDSQHRVGEALFWYAVGLNPHLICERLYAKRGDLVAMRAVIFGAMATRSAVP